MESFSPWPDLIISIHPAGEEGSPEKNLPEGGISQRIENECPDKIIEKYIKKNNISPEDEKTFEWMFSIQTTENIVKLVKKLK